MNRDFAEMLDALSAAGADFLISGAHALAAHGRPRATGDLDLWFRGLEPATSGVTGRRSRASSLTHSPRAVLDDCFESNTLIAGDVALLSKCVEGRHERRGRANGLTQRVDDSVVMLIARCSITGCGKGSSGGLQRGVVRDVHPPIGTQVFSGAVRQVALDDREKVRDFASAGLMRHQATVCLPVGQAHGHSL